MIRPLSNPRPTLVALTVIALLAPGPLGALARAPSSLARVEASRLPTPRCPSLPGSDQFVERIDNPYLPLLPGTTFTYRETADGEVHQDVVEVTDETKEILGVATTVVRDTATAQDGSLVEDTLDWYAQDRDGNVWYFGEDTKEFQNGQVVSTQGSWEAGVRGAKAGIVMLAEPQVGNAYRQECAPRVARDTAQVRQLGGSVSVPFGFFDDVLVTRDWNPLQRGAIENKYYAPCVGLVRAELVKGGKEVAELVDVQPQAPAKGSACRAARGR